MDAERIKEIQNMIKNHQNAILKTNQRPAGHNVCDEDLSKVASNDIIGKGSQHDLVK